jgi:hypothetical protein
VPTRGEAPTIAGATGQSYPLTAADVGSTIRVQETASNAEGMSEPVESEPTAVVQAVSSGSTSSSSSSGSTPGGSGSSSGGGSSAGAGSGGAVTATASASQLRADLARLTPSGKSAKIAALLKHGGLSLSFTAPEAGSLSVQWYTLSSGAQAARKAKPVLVASGRVTFSVPGRGKIKLTLTAAGKRLLKRAGRLRLTAKETFTPLGGVVTSASVSFLVRS